MIKVLVAAACMAAASSAASAASIDFTFDIAGSGVSLTPLGQPLSGCTGPGDCVSASLSANFGVPLTVSVEEGFSNAYTFDFLTFSGNGYGLYENYDVSATLAFSDPTEASTSSGGTGGVIGVINGYIKAGWLHWDDVPTVVTLDDGSKVWIDFEDGIELFLGHDITTTATLKVKSVAAPSTVPLPAGGLLLVAGLGALGVARRRRAA